METPESVGGQPPKRSLLPHQRKAYRIILASLVLFCPVLVTDFFLSGGIVPLADVLLPSLLWPYILVYYWIVIPYFVVFHVLSKHLARRYAGGHAWWLVPGGMLLLS